MFHLEFILHVLNIFTRLCCRHVGQAMWRLFYVSCMDCFIYVFLPTSCALPFVTYCIVSQSVKYCLYSSLTTSLVITRSVVMLYESRHAYLTILWWYYCHLAKFEYGKGIVMLMMANDILLCFIW